MADTTGDASARSREAWLLRAGYLFAVGSGIHLIDHLRRGQDSVTEQLYWAGNLGLIVAVAGYAVMRTRGLAAIGSATRDPALAP